MYILHRITETGVLRGDWIGSHQKIGTVTVLRDDRELEALKSPEIQKSVQVLRRPSFWDYAFSSKTSSWTSSSLKGEGNKGDESPNCTVDLKLDEDDQIKVSIIQGLKPVRHDCVKRERNEKEFNAGAERAKYIHSLKRVQNKPVQQIKSHIAAHRQLMSARGLKKLVKKENVTVFLAIVRKIGEGRRRVAKASIAAINSRSSAEKKMKASGPKKDSISVREREEQILSEIEPELREKLRGIVEEFRDVFPEKLPKGRPPERDVEHEIKTDPEAEPPNRAPYKLGPNEQDELESQIKDLVAQGFIRPSVSPYGAPVLFVPKKDGRWRMCIDYRALNKQTIKDRFPLPRIDSLLDRLGSARVFSKLDLTSGYHQIAVKEEHIHKTAFRTQLGQWEFIVMPFGLCNAPATFQRLMNKIFTKEIGDFVCVYLDDILIFSRSIEEHLEHLRRVLTRLRESKLYAKLHKCEFLKDKVDYLGFEISTQGIHASPEKVKAVVEWPRPENVHDVRSFLGLASYYRKFIRGFSEIARPLTDLTKAAKTWDWKEPQNSAFLRLKVALATAPVLLLPNFEKQFIVTTDASDAAVGAILEQDHGRGLQPIAFASRKLNSTEMRYSAYERELLGIVWALGQWRHYLEQSPHKTIIQTDHAPLKFLPNQKSVNTRIWKWVNILQGYDLELRHIPGKTNPADSLSRQLRQDALGRKCQICKEHKESIEALRVPKDAKDEDIQNALIQLFHRTREDSSSSESKKRTTLTGNSIDNSIQNSILYSIQEQDSDSNSELQNSCKLLVYRSSISLDPSFKQEIYEANQNDILYSSILSELESSADRELIKGKEKFRMKHGLLCVHQEDQSEDVDYWRIVVPDDIEVKNKILSECHSVPYIAHPGVQRTLFRIRKVFYWKGQTGDVRSFVDSCPVCQVEKSDHTLSRGQLQSTEIPTEKWHDVSIDFVTDLPESGSGIDAIMVVVDKATRMTHLIHCSKSISAAQTANLYMRYVAKLHGIPRCVYTDRGTQFVSRFWSELWKLMGTQLKYSTAYHPQTQGVVERMNSVIGQMLRCTIHELGEPRNWKNLLPTIELAINSSPNRSTGYTPFFLNYGFQPTVPAELLGGNEIVKQESVGQFVDRLIKVWEVARRRLKQAVEQQAKWYNRRHRPVSYRVGQWVLLSTTNLHLKGTPSKLQRKFVGPFKITERIGTQSYRLELPESWRIHSVFHVSLLKVWNEGVCRQISDEATPELEEPDDQQKYEVERFLRWRERRVRNRTIKEYYVLWRGYPLEEASWVPEDNFEDKEQLRRDLEVDQPTREQ